MKESHGKAQLSEYINEPYRWDQHVYLIAIVGDDDADASSLLDNGKLATMARDSGGEVFRCSNLKNIQLIFRDIAVKIASSPPTVVMKLNFMDAVHDAPLLFHASIKASGEWIIPEQFWVDLGNDLKPRNAHPLLSLSRTLNFKVPEDISPLYYLQIAKMLDIRADSYEIFTSKIFGAYGLDVKKKQEPSSLMSYFKRKGIGNVSIRTPDDDIVD